MFQHLRLEYRAILTISIVSILSIAIMVAVVSSLARRLTKDEALEKTRETANHYGEMTANALIDPLSAARALANAIEGQAKLPESVDRLALLRVMESILVHNDSYFGVWAMFEPNMLDGKDALFANTEGYPADGSFQPYVVRENGEVRIDISTGLFADYQGRGLFYDTQRQGA